MSEANFIIRARDRSKEAFAAVEGRMNKLMGGMRGIGMGNIAGALGVAGLVAYGKATMSTADEIDNLAGKLQLGLESVQSMNFMMKEAGMSGNELQGVMDSLKTKMFQALSGNKATVAEFNALGIAMDDLQKMSPEQALEAVSRALYDNQGNARANSAATVILGGASQKLQGVLMNLGSKGFAALNEEMLKTGQIMEKDMVRAGDKMEEGLSRAMNRISIAAKSKMAEFLAYMYIGLGSIGKGDEWAAQQFEDFYGEKPDRDELTPEQLSARNEEAAMAGARTSFDEEIEKIKEESRKMDEARIAMLEDQMAATEKMRSDMEAVQYTDAANLQKSAQGTLEQNRQKKADDERNALLKAIRDEIKSIQSIRIGA
jgi:hypothetical protein